MFCSGEDTWQLLTCCMSLDLKKEEIIQIVTIRNSG